MFDDLVMFSPMEARIIKILRRRKTLTVNQLVDIIYEADIEPSYPNVVVNSAIRRINLKCKSNKLSFFIDGVNHGSAGKTIWLDIMAGRLYSSSANQA